MSGVYDVLVPWCKQAEHAGQSDQERHAALNTVTLPSVSPSEFS